MGPGVDGCANHGDGSPDNAFAIVDHSRFGVTRMNVIGELEKFGNNSLGAVTITNDRHSGRVLVEMIEWIKDLRCLGADGLNLGRENCVTSVYDGRAT